MPDKPVTLTEFIIEEERHFKQATGSFTLLLTQIENAAKIIASHVKKSGLVDILGSAGKTNTSGEQVQKLDVFANELLVSTLLESGQVYAIMSEELDEPVFSKKNRGHYVVCFDPLDGSSNIDSNVSIGTIFSIYHKNPDLFQPGIKQVAAGYILYGSSVMFVYSCGRGVNGFTLDPSIGSFLLSHPKIKIPEKGDTYSINEAYFHLFDQKLQQYITDLKEKKEYKLRYIGSMVADIHRTLLTGGIFLNPANKKSPEGKLRLLFEVNPLSFIVNQAGGSATTGYLDPLIIKPTQLIHRTPIAIGSRQEVKNYILSLQRSL
ncbi:class 1 fructose-bisphosphatase [Candidatus Roizmanbacteria bacterium]|nr:class 1 fructose-bisphosphatase [Candidatus Roizmanbacteria bacterium]